MEMIILDKIWNTIHWTDGIHRKRIDEAQADAILAKWETEGKEMAVTDNDKWVKYIIR